jgi:hypothetical protein
LKRETISKVEILGNGELLLGLGSGGNSNYQYVYREAAGVYWDEGKKGFKSTEPKGKAYDWWYQHIVSVVRDIDVDLVMGDRIEWINVSDQVASGILEVSRNR